jgi:hypothetical protein
MVFQLSRTFKKPEEGANVQRGFPAPGAGAQTTGAYTPAPAGTKWSPERPIQGRQTWLAPDGENGDQRGFPSPLSFFQRRPAGSMPAVPPVSGLPSWAPTMRQSYGAEGVSPQYGKVLSNPIGAGVVARYRPQASYGSAAQYVNGVIWWTSQGVPTSVNLQGLTDPRVLEAVLGPINVQAAVRVG